MPNKTPNYNLTKPIAGEAYDVGVQNGNMDKLDAALFKKLELEIGADGKLPQNVVPDLDCGTFDVLTPVAAHNVSPLAHATMVADGNAVGEAANSGDLTTHENDPLAHQNIILDGNQN